MAKSRKKKNKSKKVKSDKRAVQSQNFINSVKSELSKVTWPTKQETIKLTLVVIAISLIIGFYLGIIDVLLARGLDLISR